jgi:hypothetical protein
MKRIIALAYVSSILVFASCTKERISGNGSTITETRSLSNFTGVSTSGSTNVYITQGAIFKVEVKGYSNLLPYYETKLVSGVLQLGYKQDVNVKNDNTEVFITMPVLNNIQLAGSGNIEAMGNFTGNIDFNARLSGSGNISIEQGSAQNFYSTIEGSGNIDALNFVANKADATIEGSGNTEITANNQLKVKITGSGNVYYRGTPAITSQITGSGVVAPK